MTEKITIVVFSGSIDRLLGMAVLTNGAIALDYEVNIFLMLWGSYAFKKDVIETNKSISEPIMNIQEFIKCTETANLPPWYELLKKAKDVGTVNIYGCSAACKAVSADLQDLQFVDAMVGAGEIIETSAESKATYFI
jgi:peroxiredoxin family protein